MCYFGLKTVIFEPFKSLPLGGQIILTFQIWLKKSLVFPSWSQGLKSAWKISCRRIKMTKCAIFLSQGKKKQSNNWVEYVALLVFSCSTKGPFPKLENVAKIHTTLITNLDQKVNRVISSNFRLFQKQYRGSVGIYL